LREAAKYERLRSNPTAGLKDGIEETFGSLNSDIPGNTFIHSLILLWLWHCQNPPKNWLQHGTQKAAPFTRFVHACFGKAGRNYSIEAVHSRVQREIKKHLAEGDWEYWATNRRPEYPK